MLPDPKFANPQNPSPASIAAIILAAGASTRMGSPKQLLHYQGRSLLRGTIETAIAAQCQPIYVVLGAFLELIQSEIKDLPIQIIVNSDWQTGIGSSIRTGIQTLLNASIATAAATNHSPVTAAILLLCDQPFVSTQTILQLKAAYDKTHPPIVASAYGDTLGVPALFSAELFPELLHLPPTAGAKKIIHRHLSTVCAIEFQPGAIDIDTPANYQELMIGGMNLGVAVPPHPNSYLD